MLLDIIDIMDGYCETRLENKVEVGIADIVDNGLSDIVDSVDIVNIVDIVDIVEIAGIGYNINNVIGYF